MLRRRAESEGADIAHDAQSSSFADRSQLWWLFGGLVLAFVVPFLFTDLVELPRNLYYALYVAAVFGFFTLWLRATTQKVRSLMTRNWKWTLALALVASAALVAVVLKEHATTRPDGWSFVGAILWRGVAYGVADGVLLSVFPILAVYALFGVPSPRRLSRWRIAGIGATALATSIVFTGVYHVGYRDFRSAKVRQPAIGDLIWSMPTLLTANPLGAPFVHATLHVTAVVHSYDTDLFLPPHRASTTNSTPTATTSEPALPTPSSVVRLWSFTKHARWPTHSRSDRSGRDNQPCSRTGPCAAVDVSVRI